MLTYEKIMVPVDFTEISHSAITKAATHSEASNSELLVIHVLDDVSLSTNNHDSLIAQAEDKLETLLDSLDIGYCEKLVVVGETVAAVLQTIKDRGIDLVVMGTHSGVALSPVMRSISMDVVTHTECDVLVLHK